MRCPKCGCDVFSVKASFITEYHDATVKVSSLMAKTVIEIDRKLEGSFYLDRDSIVIECYSCGWKARKVPDKVFSKIAKLW